jgi:hypothetical protein
LTQEKDEKEGEKRKKVFLIVTGLEPAILRSEV